MGRELADRRNRAAGSGKGLRNTVKKKVIGVKGRRVRGKNSATRNQRGEWKKGRPGWEKMPLMEGTAVEVLKKKSGD